MSDFTEIGPPEKRHKITVIGSGNWGSTISKIAAENAREHSDLFEPEVQMWVYEEEVVIGKDSPHYDAAIGEAPQKLTDVINKYHENVKYLPGIRLPDNLIANPSIVEAAKDSTILIFNLPHQFIGNACKALNGHILPYARGISCIKGVQVSDEGISLFSEWIGEGLGIYCGALSGANIASEVAAEKWCATTIAYDPPAMDQSRAASKTVTPRSESPAPGGGLLKNATPSALKNALASILDIPHKDARGRTSKVKLTPLPIEYPPLDHDTFKRLFHREYFHVRLVSDVAGVSLSGALKNVVALAAGFVIGRGWGDNAKAEIIRVGLLEMIAFGKEFFSGVIRTETFTEESAGVADLITSCSSGRNFRCAKLSIERGVSVAQIEKEELNGQLLQGTSTAHEVNSFLKVMGREKAYPLFTTVFGILEGRHTVDEIPNLVSG